MRAISDARLLAFEALVEVEIHGSYSNLVLPKMLGKSTLSPEDRAFASELVYGSLRMKGRHDALIAQASDRPLSQIDVKVLIILRIGVHQLTQMRVPSHAAIYETVELAKRAAGKSSGSFINAILRNIDGQTGGIGDDRDQLTHMSLEYSHPEWIVSSYMDSLKSTTEVESLLQANNIPARPTLIAWPGRSTIDELLADGAFPMTDSPISATCEGDPGAISAVRERRAGVQDRGSQIVVEKFLDTFEENLRWLDLCAGPGGKAAYLSSVVRQRSGDFVANEVSEERARLVRQVVMDFPVVSYDGRKLPDSLGSFDRILVDAPCTGIGALRRRPEVRWRRTLQDLKNLTVLQSELLDEAAGKIRANGVIAYVTCSSHHAETKFQVKSFLKRHPSFHRVAVQDSRIDADGDLQLWTHRDGCDSMFLSLLKQEGRERR